MFELTEFVEAHMASVTNRLEKHGDEDKPAVTMRLEITGANTLLDLIDPTLRHTLYRAVDDQPDLPGVETSTPVLRCNSIERVPLTTSHEGWTLKIDDGIDDTQPMVFGGVKVDKFNVEPKQGGSVVLSVRLGTSDVDAERLGKLGMHNGQSVWVTITKPARAPDVIDGTGADFLADHPEADAGDLFAAAHGQDDGPQDDDGADNEGSTTDVDDDGAEFEAGAAQALAAAGVKPGRGKRAKVLQ